MPCLGTDSGLESGLLPVSWGLHIAARPFLGASGQRCKWLSMRATGSSKLLSMRAKGSMAEHARHRKQQVATHAASGLACVPQWLSMRATGSKRVLHFCCICCKLGCACCKFRCAQVRLLQAQVSCSYPACKLGYRAHKGQVPRTRAQATQLPECWEESGCERE